MKIIEAKSALLQPFDRDYNKKGLPRKIHLEIKDEDISRALRSSIKLLVLITLSEVDNE